MVHNNNNNKYHLNGVRGTKKAKERKFILAFVQPTDRQTDRSESCYMCLVGMAGSDAVVRLVDKSQGQKAKNCESDPAHCLSFFMTKVPSTTPAGRFLVSTRGTKPNRTTTKKSP